MEPLINSWANRYYYSGLGLPVPAQLPSNNKYEESFSLYLSQPIAKIIGKNPITMEEITAFLQEYQRLGVKSPFYILPYLAENIGGHAGAGWQNWIKNTLSSLDKGIGVVKDGKAMIVYTDKNHKVLGTFPRTCHYLGNTSLCNQGDDIINSLLFDIPELITDEQIEAIKRVCRVSKSYEDQLRTITVEHLDSGKLVTTPIRPTDPALPPYNVRKLFKFLPTSNDTDSLHRQAYNYTKISSDVEEDVKLYLNRVINIVDANSVAPPTTEADDYSSEESKPYADDSDSIPAFGIPSDGQSFSDIGEMLDYLIRDNCIRPNWTVADIIKWYGLPESDPFTPKEHYDFNKDVLDQSQRVAIVDVIQHALSGFTTPVQRVATWLMRGVSGGTVNDSVILEELLEDTGLPDDLTIGELKAGKKKHEKREINNLDDLISSGLVSASMVGNISSLRDMQKKLVNLSSIDELLASSLLSLSLNTQIRDLKSKSEELVTMESVATQLSQLNLPDDLTVLDIMNGFRTHQKINFSTLSELVAHYGTKDNLDEFSGLLSDADTNKATMKDMREQLAVAQDQSRTELRIAKELVEELSSIDSVDKLLASKAVPENVKALLSSVPESHTAKKSSDYGYAVAEAILDGLREFLCKLNGKSFQESFAERKKVTPIYYAFVRVTGCSDSDVKDIEEFLIAERDKLEPDVRYILTSGIEILQKYK